MSNQNGNPNDDNSDSVGRRRGGSRRGVVWLNRSRVDNAAEARIADDTIYGIDPTVDTPIAVIDNDNDGIVIHWSRTLAELTGVSEDAMKG